MGCIDLFYVMSLIYLNTTTLSNLNLLILTLILFLVCKSDHIQNLIFYTLIDSGSIYYFVGTIFTIYIYIPTILILLIKLKLFDGSLNNIISKTVFLPITFSSGYWMTLNVYITSLDSSCLLVFKYN